MLERSAESGRHATVALRPPGGVRLEIDEKLAKLVELCWKRGLKTRYSCEGDPEPPEDRPPEWRREAPVNQAYITFADRLDALLFAAMAGPLAWTARQHRLRHAERPRGTERWTWDWSLDGATVRFPSRDIRRAEEALHHQATRWTVDDMIAARQRGAATPEGRPEFRVCRGCGTLISPSIRRDAVYCSRRCQLRARQAPARSGGPHGRA